MDDATRYLLRTPRGRLTPQPADRRSSSLVDIPDHDPENNAIGAAITKIEDILVSVQESLLNNEPLSIPYRPCPGTRRTAANPANAAGPQRLAVCFPGQTDNEAIKFTRLFKILQMSLSALMSGHPITKRNIYYQNQDLFGGQQSIVDRLVDDLAYTLGLGRDGLFIVAAGKGLVAGPILLYKRDYSPSTDASSSDTGVLIPTTSNIAQVDFRRAEWVVVIEKEACLVRYSTRSWRLNSAGDISNTRSKTLLGHVCLRAGYSCHGYPDLNTRQFLHQLHAAKPELPMFALVDFDPDGINIMRCYSHGSRGSAHEVGTTVPGLQWLGIKSDDLAGRRRPQNDGQRDRYGNLGPFPSQMHYEPQEGRRARDNLGSTNPLTLRDFKRAVNMLKDIGEDVDDYSMECRRELQVMLFLGVKAEIQAVDNAGDMSYWLDEHMRIH